MINCTVSGATILAQTVTAIMATAALIVSIISLYLQRRDKRPQLRVTGSVSTLVDAELKPVEYVYMLSVANRGQMPTTVTQVYLWDKPDWKIVFPAVRGQMTLPCKLEPGEGTSWWVNYEELREALRQMGHEGKIRVKLEATDATGGSHTKRENIILNAPWWRRIFRG